MQFLALSSLCGGSTCGFLGPLRSSNCVSVCTSFLYIGAGACLCVGTDDSVIRSPLPITCIHSMSLTSAPLPLHSSTCMLSIDFNMMHIGSGAFFGGTDDSVIKSLLPITCIQSMSSILAPWPLELLPCYLTLGSRYGVGIDDSSRSPLPFTCIAHTHVFNFSLPSLDLSVREFLSAELFQLFFGCSVLCVHLSSLQPCHGMMP